MRLDPAARVAGSCRSQYNDVALATGRRYPYDDPAALATAVDHLIRGIGYIYSCELCDDGPTSPESTPTPPLRPTPPPSRAVGCRAVTASPTAQVELWIRPSWTMGSSADYKRVVRRGQGRRNSDGEVDCDCGSWCNYDIMARRLTPQLRGCYQLIGPGTRWKLGGFRAGAPNFKTPLTAGRSGCAPMLAMLAIYYVTTVHDGLTSFMVTASGYVPVGSVYEGVNVGCTRIGYPGDGACRGLGAKSVRHLTRRAWPLRRFRLPAHGG